MGVCHEWSCQAKGVLGFNLYSLGKIYSMRYAIKLAIPKVESFWITCSLKNVDQNTWCKKNCYPTL